MSHNNNQFSSENKKKINDLDVLEQFSKALKLKAAILHFINEIPEKLDRKNLCKHLFYADGHFYQKYGRQITEYPYLHIEGSPQPLFFNEIFYLMRNDSQIEIIPKLVKEKGKNGMATVMKGFVYKAKEPAPDIFSKEEKKVLKSISSLFKGNLILETRHFPNLYQSYVQSGLYEKIIFTKLPEGKKPHLSWKAWAQKVFRLLWQ
ncbi:MAG: Panacea domain-containing protein [Spirochaetia bacterium]|nr:Panacea domain-containing protein [Spirochaetia bacterium]